MKLNVRIKRLTDDAVIPQYAHEYDAGVDLVASEDVIIEPGETKLVPTGIAVSIPPGFEAQVRPRSGITLKTKLRIQLGTIDSGFTGEIGVIVDNIAVYPDLLEIPTMDGEYVVYGIDGKYHHCSENINEGGAYIIRKGDRIAQLVFAPIEQAQFSEVKTLGETSRGEGGFGSSGVKAE